MFAASDVLEPFGALGAILFVVAAIAFFVATWVLAAVFAVAAIGQVAQRRPFLVEAKAFDGTVHHWEVSGWRASGRFARRVREHLASGTPVPDP